MRNTVPVGRVIVVILGVCAFASVTAFAADSTSPRLLDKFLAGPMGEVEEIIFAARQPGAGGHWYENFGYYCQDDSRKVYRAMGQLAALNIRTGRVRILLDDKEGSIRDPQVHYDAKKILFSYRKAGFDYFHLYEINADGAALKQLTHGPYDDLEPTYLPDGGIIFCSSRCNRS